MSVPPSLREPQLSPPDHAYVIVQDYGPGGGGWGPAAISILGLPPAPFVYTGRDESTIAGIMAMAEAAHVATGKPTLVVRFGAREVVAAFGSSPGRRQ